MKKVNRAERQPEGLMDVLCLSPFISPLLYNVRARRELSSPSSPIPSFTDEDNEAERRSVISSRAHSQLEATEGENPH